MSNFKIQAGPYPSFRRPWLYLWLSHCWLFVWPRTPEQR